jgi:GT2 family glycosyltransferase
MKEAAEITALMLYYGRRSLAEEAMESFLRQTYPHKCLLIVNTHPDPVYFEQEYPNVTVHNLAPDYFKNLNAKYNYALKQVETNWWAPWDSDDIWLPWHFENLVKIIPSKSQAPLLENRDSQSPFQPQQRHQ